MSISQQLRSLAGQLDAGAAAVGMQLLPNDAVPQSKMVFTPDGQYIAENFWMDGCLGASDSFP